MLVGGCGYHFGNGPQKVPFSGDIKTLEIPSATNNTTVTGIEEELTNDLRNEFALGTRLETVRSGGDAVLSCVITSYEDTPVTLRADGKELTRVGTLKIQCSLKRAADEEILWQRPLAATSNYLVSDSIAETLGNRRAAISRMIRDLIVKTHRSLYDDF